MFAENAVFSRALGVSRLVKLVDDSTVDTLVFGGLMCAVQLISAPLAKVCLLYTSTACASCWRTPACRA